MRSAPFLDVLQRLDAIDKALKENQQQILFLLRNQRQEKGTNVTEAKSEQVSCRSRRFYMFAWWFTNGTKLLEIE